MGNVVPIAEHREKFQTPVEALEAFVAAVKAGEMPMPTTLFIAWLEPSPDGTSSKPCVARAGGTLFEEMALCDFTKWNLMMESFGG